MGRRASGEPTRSRCPAGGGVGTSSAIDSPPARSDRTWRACARSDRSSTPRSVSVSARPSHQPSLTQPSRRLEDGVEMPLEELLVGPVTSAFGGGDGLSDPRVELLPVAELGAQTRADEEPVLEVHA